MSYSRFAIYYVPPNGPLADFGTAWLGWDIVKGRKAEHPNVNGVHEITTRPRKYGFHGTLKPPFRLEQERTVDDLLQAVHELSRGLAPAFCDSLALQNLGRFLALTPRGDVEGIQTLADACVRDLDAFRAAMNGEELARRRQLGLSPEQDKLLAMWGYPYVMGQFRFHMTLSGPLKSAERARWFEQLSDLLPELPEPFVIDQIALCGERQDGNFELINRYVLTG